MQANFSVPQLSNNSLMSSSVTPSARFDTSLRCNEIAWARRPVVASTCGRVLTWSHTPLALCMVASRISKVDSHSQSKAVRWATQALLQVPPGQLFKVVEEVVLPLCAAVEYFGVYRRLVPGGALSAQ